MIRISRTLSAEFHFNRFLPDELQNAGAQAPPSHALAPVVRGAHPSCGCSPALPAAHATAVYASTGRIVCTAPSSPVRFCRHRCRNDGCGLRCRVDGVAATLVGGMMGLAALRPLRSGIVVMKVTAPQEAPHHGHALRALDHFPGICMLAAAGSHTWASKHLKAWCGPQRLLKVIAIKEEMEEGALPCVWRGWGGELL